MSDHTDLPFKAEYAKSGRSSCKACKLGISQASLRLAVMVQSPMFDGKVPNWYHYACFWKRARVAEPTDIHGIDSLRWDDQEKIKEKVKGGGGGEGDASAGVSMDFTTEYAKSGKSMCRGCDDKIAKDEVRISKKEYESQRAKMYGPVDLWYHVDCFVEKRDELEFGSDMNVEKIKGFAKLKKEDKDMLIEKLGKGEAQSGKKRKAGDSNGAAGGKKKKTKEETAEEKALKEQSQLLWKYRDALQKEVNNAAMKLLLELNKQGIPPGESKLLDVVADCMAFGALANCPECKEGSLRYATDGYKCTGNMTEWTKCMYKTKTPVRKAFKVPKEYHDVEVFKTYKYVKRDRVFPAVTVRTTEGPVSSSMDSVDSAVNFHPLEGMKFVLSGKFSKSKADITAAITRMGGTVSTKCDKTVTACISNKDEVEKKSKMIKEAEKAGVHVVDEGFLDAAQKGGAVLMITQHSIAPWGSDVRRSGGSEHKKKKKGSLTRTSSKKVKMVYSHQQLLEAYHMVTEEGWSIIRAATLCGVPRSTLRDRLDNKVPLDCTRPGPDTIFTPEEEMSLCDYLRKLATLGYCYRRAELLKLASEYAVVLGKRTAEKPLTVRWFYKFLERWPEIKSMKSFVRINDTQEKQKDSKNTVADSFFINRYEDIYKAFTKSQKSVDSSEDDQPIQSSFLNTKYTESSLGRKHKAPHKLYPTIAKALESFNQSETYTENSNQSDSDSEYSNQSEPVSDHNSVKSETVSDSPHHSDTQEVFVPQDAQPDMSESETESNISDSEKCCVCKKYYVEKNDGSTVTNWVECRDCSHWVHLKYCTPLETAEYKTMFRCNCCLY